MFVTVIRQSLVTSEEEKWKTWEGGVYVVRLVSLSLGNTEQLPLGPGSGRHPAITGREGIWAPASRCTLKWWRPCAAVSDFPQSNRWRAPPSQILRICFMFSSTDPGWAWRRHINLYQVGEPMGARVRNEKAPTHMRRAAGSHNPHLGQPRAKGATSRWPLPRPWSPGSAGHQPRQRQHLQLLFKKEKKPCQVLLQLAHLSESSATDSVS